MLICPFLFYSKRILNFVSTNHQATQLFSILTIRNVSSALNQHIRMISERSCDTMDWNNDAENLALPSQE